jgi:hypothetical protein
VCVNGGVRGRVVVHMLHRGGCSHPASLVVFTFSYKGEKRMLGKAAH